MSLALVPRGRDPGTCGHAARESLGFDGPAEFFACHGCGCILVSRGGRLWILRSSRGGPESQGFTF